MTNKDLQMKCNGLSSSTKIHSEYIGGGITKEVHINPETSELITMHTWSVQDGDCVTRDCEVIECK